MGESIERDRYDIEKSVYETQWTNIRHHWTQSFAATTLLTTLVTLAAVPIHLVRSGAIGGSKDSVSAYVRVFVALVIVLFGAVTLMNHSNQHSRSREARKVVVAIEREWGLYDQQNHFIFQGADSKYDYAKFAGGEKRLSFSKVQSVYIILITLTGLGFVVFA